MKLVLISAIAASVFITASPAPSFAQSARGEGAEQSQAMHSAKRKPARHVRKPARHVRQAKSPEGSPTIITAISELFSSSTSDGKSSSVPRRRTTVAAVDRSSVASSSRPPAESGSRPYDSMIATHASSNGVPAELVHRIIVRESRYRAGSVGRGGATGLMQIKLATARGMGYTGTATGLLDPETNLAYGVKYLAGAYRAAGGHQGRAVGYYASGYYYAAKRQRLQPVHAFAEAQNAPALVSTEADAPVTPVTRKVHRKHRR